MWGALWRHNWVSHYAQQWTSSYFKCTIFSSHDNCLIFCQVSQRLSKWRSSFGSAAIALLNAFFDDNNDYRDSNSMRQEFSTYMLDKMCFVYRDNDRNNKLVYLHLLHNMQHTQCNLSRNSMVSFLIHLLCRLCCPLQCHVWFEVGWWALWRR